MARNAGSSEMQPLTSIEVASDTTVLKQPKREWLDAGEFADAYFVVDAPNITAMTLELQTSPVEEDDYFVTMSDCTLTQATAAAGTHMYVRASAVSTPLMRFVRWQATATGSNAKATFRIMSIFKRR